MSHTVKLRPLLPLAAAASGPPPVAPTVTRPPKRKASQVLAACNGCRKRKVKCDGVRPSCYTCKTSDSPCVYPVPEGLSQRQAQKQKLDYASRAYENSHRVLKLLRASRDGASQDILKQLQHSEHPDEAVQSIADASLLLPKFHEQRRESSSKSLGGSLSAPKASGLDFRVNNSTTHSTIVPQDNKLLTHLLDMFWIWDGTLSHLVDQELFITDLNSIVPDLPTAQSRSFCSSFLINAILAVASVRVQKSNQPTRNTQEFQPILRGFRRAQPRVCPIFFRPARVGKEFVSTSLTLMQGVVILWLFTNNEGSRASRTQASSLSGLLQRTWSELGLETGGPMAFRVSGKNEAHNFKIWKVVSHMTWGFYCFFAYVFHKPTSP
ncbi:C6 transcription factor [Colletotrichum tofieldiae]|uniref:C6 transcription factor n=1 Tax=Colletotrichum tofieldiae TaxID=708197 RepID=A0A166QFH4_9PEZI|nr:C6 transcription factor [Colletotrichum tofieldiae]